jgi:hypothetical protein
MISPLAATVLWSMTDEQSLELNRQSLAICRI